MKVRCEYCKNYIDDSEEKCPNCGAVNKDYKRTANEMPTTIEELKKWYEDHHLPPSETTRFFIGIDYKEPRAFGIYKDPNTGKYVVYKNKEDGTRALRYEGKDEKYAVNELYLKLKEEVAFQKNLNYDKNDNKQEATTNPYIVQDKTTMRITLFFILIFAISVIFGGINNRRSGPSRGYYSIDGTEYYYANGNWYWYVDDKWSQTSEPEHDNRIDTYYDKRYYDGSNSFPDIKSSSVYDSSWDLHDSWSSSSDWDSDLDWDSGDSWDYGGTWDSGGIDWNSDW